jgi:hypothetical protein
MQLLFITFILLSGKETSEFQIWQKEKAGGKEWLYC